MNRCATLTPALSLSEGEGDMFGTLAPGGGEGRVRGRVGRGIRVHEYSGLARMPMGARTERMRPTNGRLDTAPPPRWYSHRLNRLAYYRVAAACAAALPRRARLPAA